MVRGQRRFGRWWWAGALFVVLAACGDQGAPVTTGEPTTPSPTAEVRVVEEKAADLLLWVSNQSFEDDPVQITVSVDGVPLIDKSFAVEGQHNWILFPVALEPGRHELVAVSDTGVELRETLRIPKDGLRYAVLDYWYYPDDRHGRHFSWMVQDEPVAFA